MARRQLSKLLRIWKNGFEIYLHNSDNDDDENTSLKLNALLCLTIAFIIHSKRKENTETNSTSVFVLIQDCRSNERASNSGRCCDFDTSYHLNPIRANWNPGDNHFHGAHIKNVICSGGSGVHFTQKHPILCRYGARRSEYCNEKEKYHVRVNFDWNFYILAITLFVGSYPSRRRHLNI